MFDLGTYVIIRSRDAGVFAGTLQEQSADGTVVLMAGCRRLWHWDGAATISELAVTGPKRPGKCKFPPSTPKHQVLGVCEVVPCSDVARKAIEGVPEWVA